MPVDPVIEPEVTREEAERAEAELCDGGLCSHRCQLVPPLARTVLALYDRLDARDEGTVALYDEAVRQVTAGAIEREAMRECIDRLRSGWHAWNLDMGVLGPPTHWYRQSIRGWEDEPEPMTPEQAAVMAR